MSDVSVSVIIFLSFNRRDPLWYDPYWNIWGRLGPTGDHLDLLDL